MNQHLLLCSGIMATLTTATTASLANDSPLRGDLAKIQGKWAATVEFRPGIRVSWFYRIEGNTVLLRTTSANGQLNEHRGGLTIDESAKPHKTLDWVKNIGPNGEERPDIPAIYEFVDDDTLRICQPPVGRQRSERPTEFGPDLPAVAQISSSLILRRVKDEN